MAKSTPPPSFVPAEPAQAVAAPTGSAYVPDLGSVTRTTPVTRVDAAPPFLLKAHPERWTVMGKQIVPSFGRIVLQAGVSGVSARPDGKVDAMDARNASESAGWTIIPVTAVPDSHAQLAPDGSKVKSYLYRPEGRPDVTLLLYTKVFPGSTAIECDEPRYLEFCQHLIDSGVIQPPAGYVLEALRNRLAKDAANLSDKAREHSQFTADAKRLAEQVAVVETALASTRAPSTGSAVVVDA